MRAIFSLPFMCALALALACGGPGGGGGGPDGALCQVPECEFAYEVWTDPDDPAQPSGKEVDTDRGYVRAFQMCSAGANTLEELRDWSRAVVIDLETGEPAFAYTRDGATEGVREVECSGASEAVVMTRLTPPLDWRVGSIYFPPCEQGNTHPCGCPDGSVSERVCSRTRTADEPFDAADNPWGACDCG